MKHRIILVTGGARSGKTVLAERLARHHSGGETPVYIATAQPHDAEMGARIAAHRRDRGADWRTIEAPLDLPAALAASEGAGARLIDCLTLWLSNALPDAADLDGLRAALAAAQAPVVLVTNELGQGIVPDNALARRFRDDHGRMNQAVATLADQVWLAVAGQPLRLKPPIVDFP